MFVSLFNRPDMNRTTHVSLQRGATSSPQQISLIQFSLNGLKAWAQNCEQ